MQCIPEEEGVYRERVSEGEARCYFKSIDDYRHKKYLIRKKVCMLHDVSINYRLNENSAASYQQ